ncbi:hypothetical protein [Microvirga arabica]|uniref:hypothetical protein n=1 Tax=Microvirga arabica TaxID=1128671 RepID=UPI001FE6AF05|nr:hypothetical protein [Microvirga arabica]
MATRSELVEAIIECYRSSGRVDKQLILDEFVAVTGYHRKHAIRLLCRCQSKKRWAKTPVGSLERAISWRTAGVVRACG